MILKVSDNQHGSAT